MSESIYEPGSDGIDTGDAVDLDQEFGDDATDAMYDTSYSPPEFEPVNTKFGTTLEEEQAGETLEQRVAQEIPDPNLASDLGADEDEDDDEVDEDTIDEEDLVFGEVGDERAGRLVASDEGAHEDREKDLNAEDVGIDAGAASAEEAAVHVIPD